MTISRKRSSRRAAGALAVLLCLGPASALAAPLPLTFQEASARLHKVSPAVEAGRRGVEHAQAQRDAAKWLDLPEVLLGAQYIGYSKDLTLDLSGLKGALPPLIGGLVPSSATTTLDGWGPRLNATAVWPIYTGGRINAAQGALAAGVDAAGAEAREIEEQQGKTLVQRYFGLQLARAAHALRLKVAAGIGEHLEAARKFEAQGLIARVERLHAEVAHDEALRNVAKARQDEAIAAMALGRLLQAGEGVDATTPLFMSAALPPLEAFLDGLSGRQPLLAAIDARRSQAAQGVQLKRAHWMPDLLAFGNYQFVRKDLSPIEPDWVAGVALSWRLLDGTNRARAVEAAEATEARLDALRREAQTGMETLAEKAWREADVAIARHRLLGSNLALARETLRLREAAFRESTGTSLEVVDARLALARAEIERYQVAYDFVTSLSELLAASGQAERFQEFLEHAEVRFAPGAEP